MKKKQIKKELLESEIELTNTKEKIKNLLMKFKHEIDMDHYSALLQRKRAYEDKIDALDAILYGKREIVWFNECNEIDQEVINKLKSNKEKCFIEFCDGRIEDLSGRIWRPMETFPREIRYQFDYVPGSLNKSIYVNIGGELCKIIEIESNFNGTFTMCAKKPNEIKDSNNKDRVCSELAEKYPFHINDFRDEYDKIKSHFPENKLKDRLRSIAEFATSVNCRMYHVGNFLIENKSTS